MRARLAVTLSLLLLASCGGSDNKSPDAALGDAPTAIDGPTSVDAPSSIDGPAALPDAAPADAPFTPTLDGGGGPCGTAVCGGTATSCNCQWSCGATSYTVTCNNLSTTPTCSCTEMSGMMGSSGMCTAAMAEPVTYCSSAGCCGFPTP